MKKIKQISYLSAIVIIIGSTIGAGIFFKNGELFRQGQGNLWLVVASWTVAGFGIGALALALGEVISASKTNRGVLEWFKNFLPGWVSRSAKNYTQLIFVPITMFTIPLYVVQTWQEAGMAMNSDWGPWALGLAIFIWIAIISLISFKASERLQWALTALKFVPILIVPIIALVNTGNFSSSAISVTDHSKAVANNLKTGLLGVAPAIILIGGIPAISFAFDGFYEVSSLRNNLKKPKQLGAITAIATAIILFIYIFITISFALGSDDGTITSIKGLSPGVQKAMSVLIGIGIMGIVNGYMMSSVQKYAALEEEGEAPVMTFQRRLLAKMGKNSISTITNAWISIVFSTVLFFLILGPIGIHGWKQNDYSSLPGGNGTLYTFVDVIVNYTSSLTFALITLSVVGAMVNRFTNKVKVEKSKVFWPAAIISSVILLSGVMFQFIVGIVDAFGFNGADSSDSIIKLGIFAFIILVSIVAGVIEHHRWDETKHKMMQPNTEI